MTTTAIMVGFKSSTRISQRINALRALLDPRALANWNVPYGMRRHVRLAHALGKLAALVEAGLFAR